MFGQINALKLRASVLRDSYFEFVKAFWPVVVAEAPVWNWHIEYICGEVQECLERVFRNRPKEYDLIDNQPPGTSKSLVFSVFQLPWAWTNMPSFRFIGASYSFPLAMHLSRLSRDVVKSDLYRKLFPEVQIRIDQDTKAYFANTKGGTRYAVGAGGSITGMHGHAIVIDDPLNPNEAASEAQLAQTNFWISKTLLSRKVSKRVSVVELVMQRLHEDDPTSLFLEKGGCRHLCFPAELRDGYAVKPAAARRYYRGGLFDPERLDKRALEESRKELGDVGYAGQYGQNPVPPGGAMFDVDQITLHDAREPLPHFVKEVRFWDKAATTEKEDSRAAYTTGVRVGLTEDGVLYVRDVKRGRWNTGVREKVIRTTARRDGPRVAVGLEQEPGSGGKESAEKTKRMLRGFRVYVVRPTGDKVQRAQPFSVEVNMGRVVLVPGPWNKEYVRELMFFPFGRYKDQVDASSGANSVIEGGMRRAGGIPKKHREETVLRSFLPSKKKHEWKKAKTLLAASS
jgi:predicted phage terminase large subunit-like protein